MMDKDSKITVAQAYMAMHAFLMDYKKTLIEDEAFVISLLANAMEFLPYKSHSADPACWSDFLYFAEKAKSGELDVLGEYINKAAEERSKKNERVPVDAPRDWLKGK